MHFISLFILVLAVLFGFAPASSFKIGDISTNVSVFESAFGSNRVPEPNTILIIFFVFLFISIILLFIFSINDSLIFLKVAALITIIITTIWIFKSIEGEAFLGWGLCVIASLVIAGLLVLVFDLIFELLEFKENLASKSLSRIMKKQFNNQTEKIKKIQNKKINESHTEKIDKIHNETVNESYSESTDDSQDKYLKYLEKLYTSGKINKEFYDKKVEEYKSKS